MANDPRVAEWQSELKALEPRIFGMHPDDVAWKRARVLKAWIDAVEIPNTPRARQARVVR